MSDVNAAATLSLAISTGDAAKQLQELKAAYAALKGEFATGLQATGISKEAADQIQKLGQQVQTLQSNLKSMATEHQAQIAVLNSNYEKFEKARVAGQQKMADAARASTAAQSANAAITNKLLQERAAAAEVAAAAERRLAEASRNNASAAQSSNVAITNKLLQERAAAAEVAAAAERRLAEATRANASAAQSASAASTVKLLQERAAAAEVAAAAERRLAEATRANAAAAQAASQANTARLIQERAAAASGTSTRTYNPLTNTYTTTLAQVATAGALSQNMSQVATAGALSQNMSQVATATSRATVAQHNWNKVAKDGHALARGLSGSLGTLWMTYGQLVPLMAGAALGAGFKQATVAGAEFAHQLNFVKALGGESSAAIESIGAAALNLSKTSLYGPVELANGLRILSQAGLDATQSLAALPSVMQLATVGEMSMEQASLTLIGVMNAFGKGLTDLGHIGDVFAKAAALSQTSVQQMTEAMKTASVAHDQYGASLEDTATAVTLLAKVNITGTAAGTAYRNMLKDIYTPSAQAAEMMKTLGVEAKDSAGNLREFPDIMRDLRKELANYSPEARTEIIGRIFSERGGKQAVQMLNAVAGAWDDLKTKVSESDGFMRNVTAQLEMDTQGRFKQVVNSMQATLIDAFNATEGPIRKLADSLRNLVDSETFRAGAGAVVSGMAAIASAALNLTPALVALGVAWASVKATMLVGLAWDTAIKGLMGIEAALITVRGAVTASGLAGLGSGIAKAGAAAAAAGNGGIAAFATALTNLPLTAVVAAVGYLAWKFYEASTAVDPVIAKSRSFTEELGRERQRLDESNAALQKRIDLMNGQKTATLTAAEANSAALEARKAQLEAELAAAEKTISRGTGADGYSIASAIDVDRAASTVDLVRDSLKKVNAELANAKQAVSAISGSEWTHKRLSQTLGLKEAQDQLAKLKDDLAHINEKSDKKVSVDFSRLEALIQNSSRRDLTASDLRKFNEQKDRLVSDINNQMLGGSGTKRLPATPNPSELRAAAAASAAAAAAAARRRANKDAERDEKATIASYTERQNAEIASLASRAQNKLISEERNQMELVAIYAKYDDVIAEQYEAGINRLKTLQANAKADEKDALKAALTEMETAQAKFESDKLLRLQQSKDREQGIIKASNEATNKFIAEQEAAVQKQLEDLQEARVKSKMSAREEVQYDAGRNAELVFRKEEAAQLERIRSLRQDLIDQNMAAGQDFISAVANAESNGQLAAYVAKLDELVKKRGELVNKATAVAGDNYDFTRDFSTGWDKAFKEYEKAATDSAANARDMFNASATAMSDGLTQFFTTGKIGWQDLANTVLNQIARIMANRMTAQFMGILDGLFSSSPIVPSTAGLTNTTTLAGIEALSANGNVFSGAPGLHQYVNTVQDSPKVFAFDRLHKYAKGGVFAEAGPEAVMPLARDSNGRLGVRAQGSGMEGISIVVNNTVSDQAQATVQPRMNNGKLELEVLIQQVLAKDMQQNGRITQGMANTFGLARTA